MTYDASENKVVMFGGTHQDSSSAPVTFFGDLWAYDVTLGFWEQLSLAGTGPSARSGHCMVYDPDRKKVIVYGGYQFSPEGSTTYLDDLWEYDPAQDGWTLVEPSGDVPPVGGGRSMVYDTHRDRLLLFGGATDDGSDPVFSNDLWEYDPAARVWTKLEPSGVLPHERATQSMAYDSDTGQTIVYGGWYSFFDADGLAQGVTLNDMWAYDPVANSWKSLEASGDIPGPTSGVCMVYSEAIHRCILFLSVLSPEQVLSGTWTYDPATGAWTRSEISGTSPPGRWAASMVYCAASQEVLLWGGMAPEDVSAPILADQSLVYFDEMWRLGPVSRPGG